MTCDQFDDIVTDLASGRLAEGDTWTSGRQHADVCVPCADRLAAETAVCEALRLVREAPVPRPSPAIESAALRAARAHRAQPPRQPFSMARHWASAAALALAAGLGWWWNGPAVEPTDPPVTAPAGASRPEAPVRPGPVEVAPAPSAPVAPSAPRTPRNPGSTSAPRRAAASVAAGAAEPTDRQAAESLGAFVWLPYGAPDTFDTAHVVRVRVPRAVLSSMGLTVDGGDLSGVVHAEVVVGGDGMARAIRLVSPAADAPFE